MRRILELVVTVLTAALAASAALAQEQTRTLPGPDGRPLVSRVVRSGTVHAREFGVDGTEYSQIGAFAAIDSVVVYEPTEHFYMYPTKDGTWLIADLGVPDGVFLQGLTMFFLDLDQPTDLTLSLCRGANHGDGTAPSFDCPWNATPVGTPGYSAVTMDVNATVQYSFDLDGDGTRDDVRWYVFVQFPSAEAPTYLGGVRAAWNRQVSPAPTSATFTDVPTDHPQFQFIEALAASGITAGCGGGNFCPAAPLTRGQMAVFLAKALGLYWSAATP